MRPRAFREALDAAISHVGDRGVEHVVALNPAGEVLWEGSGTRRKVATPRDLEPDATIVHTHPSDAPFSRVDLAGMINQDERGCVAVGPRHVYVIERDLVSWHPLPLLAENVLRDWEARDHDPSHAELLALARIWPAARYARYARRTGAERFVVRPDGGVMEALGDPPRRGKRPRAKGL